MIKIKQLSIYNASLGVILVFFFVLFAPLYGRASAAEPGCYAGSTYTNSSNEVISSITAANCPEDIQPQVDNGQKCFIATVSSSGQTPFREADCSAITVGDSDIGRVEDRAATPSEEGDLVKVDLDGQGFEIGDIHYCGKGAKKVRISFDIGCIGEDYSGTNYNPVLDMLFALLRFVSLGVGIIVTASMVWAGIQYSTSRGNPQATEAALKRISNAVIALLIYIFAWAILNFLVPGGLFI